MGTGRAESLQITLRSGGTEGGKLVVQWPQPTNRFIVVHSGSLSDEFLTLCSADGSETNQIEVLPAGNLGFYRMQFGLMAVDVNDPQLERLLAAQISQKHGPTNRIYDTELAGITSLDATDEGVQVLDGLGFVADLEELRLSYDLVYDMRPLQGLDALRSLDAGGNDLVSLAGLEGCAALERLNLSGNRITDLSVLSSLNQLREVFLGRNQIGSIIPLSGLNALEILDLADNQIGSLAALSGLHALRELYLDGNQIEDLTGLAGLLYLHRVDLSDNQIQSICPLLANAAAGGLGQGDSVFLTGNPLLDGDEIVLLRGYGVEVVVE